MELEQSGALLESGTYEGECWQHCAGNILHLQDKYRCLGRRNGNMCFSSAILLFLNLICRLVQLCTYLFLMDQVCQVMLIHTALVNKMSLTAYSFLWWFLNSSLTLACKSWMKAISQSCQVCASALLHCQGYIYRWGICWFICPVAIFRSLYG